MFHSTIVFANCIFDDYWTVRPTLGSLIPPYLPLNTVLISHMAGVPIATVPHAWSADLNDLSRNAYRNNL